MVTDACDTCRACWIPSGRYGWGSSPGRKILVAATRISDNVVRIGVLGDVVAARRAVEDFGGKVRGMPIEIVSGDLLGKTDGGVGIARQWFDQGVDAIFSLGNSAVAIAVQGMLFVAAFYWDQNEATRGFAQRFCKPHGKMPTMFQASVYSAVTHYLKAIDAAGTDEAQAVMAKMPSTPINDFMTVNGRIREDGRVIRDLYLMQVKAPAESKGEWDLAKVIATVPGDQAFRPLSESECPLVTHRGDGPPPVRRCHVCPNAGATPQIRYCRVCPGNPRLRGSTRFALNSARARQGRLGDRIWHQHPNPVWVA